MGKFPEKPIQPAINLDHLSAPARINHHLQVELRRLDGVLSVAHERRMTNPACNEEYERIRAYQDGLMFAVEAVREAWKV